MKEEYIIRKFKLYGVAGGTDLSSIINISWPISSPISGRTLKCLRDFSSRQIMNYRQLMSIRAVILSTLYRDSTRIHELAKTIILFHFWAKKNEKYRRYAVNVTKVSSSLYVLSGVNSIIMCTKSKSIETFFCYFWQESVLFNIPTMVFQSILFSC